MKRALAEGDLDLPLHVREELHPGSLVRFHLVDGHYVLIQEDGDVDD